MNHVDLRLTGASPMPCDCSAVHSRRRVVLTGGPGAGKTAVLELVRRTLCEHLVVVPEAGARGLLGAEPGADISRHLARHGVPVVLEQRDGHDAGRVLLDRARDLDADMLVMGAYSQSRVRRLIFGGVTRDILESAGLPVMMAH